MDCDWAKRWTEKGRREEREEGPSLGLHSLARPTRTKPYLVNKYANHRHNTTHNITLERNLGETPKVQLASRVRSNKPNLQLSPVSPLSLCKTLDLTPTTLKLGFRASFRSRSALFDSDSLRAAGRYISRQDDNS
ncbi:hypothetical protein PIB30_041895 [Stylosanthes scabra]|uniref:Uncharacterized protein n=1 Tax=Stylosanthes scabra TaxID=79078 RepID=A0ABU6YCF5_9FABA|nr:hypothetical protein [Stylosanthes scabra]